METSAKDKINVDSAFEKLVSGNFGYFFQFIKLEIYLSIGGDEEEIPDPKKEP